MNRVFHKNLDSFVLVFIGDILVCSANHHVWRENLKTVLEVLGEKKHFAELKKRAFSLEEVSLFGHVASKDGNAVQLKKIEAIVEWERPTSVRQICSFLGFDGYSHGFTVRFSAMSGPPPALTGKSAPKFWREQYVGHLV